jgi:hypothetical protein
MAAPTTLADPFSPVEPTTTPILALTPPTPGDGPLVTGPRRRQVSSRVFLCAAERCRVGVRAAPPLSYAGGRRMLAHNVSGSSKE